MIQWMRPRVFLVVLLALVGSVVSPLPLNASDSLTVSVTPPFTQLTIGPGEFWASTLKIVNPNDHDVTYYANVVNFENTGEAGKGKFIPLLSEFDGTPADQGTLARWIGISEEPVTVPAGKSFDVPFTVRIPADASPGGHYAAILVGTRPTKDAGSTGSSVLVSSYVSSLFFVKIKGDVVEKGRIREFIPEKSLYEKPEAKFVLRFENQGNVHLQPRGTIEIFNMWGKERGKMQINEKTNFGNVLPNSVRRFEFDWSGEYSPFDIGRYSAIVTLAYGDEQKQNVSATTYFWVVPIIPVATTAGALLFGVGVIGFFIRRYIRRVLELERVRLGGDVNQLHETPHLTLQAMTLPIREGVVDLRRVSSTVEDSAIIHDVPSGAPLTTTRMDGRSFVAKYKLFFVALVVFTALFALAVWYFGEVTVSSRDFEIESLQVQDEE